MNRHTINLCVFLSQFGYVAPTLLFESISSGWLVKLQLDLIVLSGCNLNWADDYLKKKNKKMQYCKCKCECELFGIGMKRMLSVVVYKYDIAHFIPWESAGVVGKCDSCPYFLLIFQKKWNSSRPGSMREECSSRLVRRRNVVHKLWLGVWNAADSIWPLWASKCCRFAEGSV